MEKVNPTLALVSEQNRKLSPEQQARKSRLLSRFRYFDAAVYPEWYYPQPHDEMCDQLEACRPDIGVGTRQKKTLYMTPRYTYKTSKLKSYAAYLILWFREYGVDISIDYVRAESSLAEDWLFELKQDFQSNETILELWGDVSQHAEIWSAKRINLGTRRDMTISTAGLDYGGAGKHPDLVFVDDAVNEKNYDSNKAKRAARVKLQAYYPILPPWGSIIVCGTRFAHNDVYGWILEQNAKDRRKFESLLSQRKFEEAEKFRPQWTEYIRRVRDKNGNLFFPEKLTEEFLAQQKRSVEAKFYAAWYENDPDVEGMVRFRPEYLEYFSASFSWAPIPMLTLLRDAANGKAYAIDTFPVRVTMTLDPTLTANQTSDWVGITVVATDASGKWWTMLARRYLEVPSKMGDIALDIIREFRPAVCRIESANADAGMVARIQEGILLEGLPTVIRGYSALQDEPGGSPGRPSRRKKNARIEALEPDFRNSRIALHRNTCEALYDQYINWPDVDQDDVFDALAMQRGIAVPCRYRTLAEYEAQWAEELDDEPPTASSLMTYRLFDRSGNPVVVTADYKDRGDEGRLLGRAGIASQRLRAR